MATSVSNVYTDVDLNFIPNPHTGDLIKKTDLGAVQRAVWQALHLKPFDIPFNPTLKSDIYGYLFEENNVLTKANLQSDIEFLLKKIEPRIKLQKVEIVTDDPTSITVKITYQNSTLNQIDTFSVIFSRVR